MNILFYYPSNKRTIPIDIPLKKLQERGHQIFLLTSSAKGTLHQLYADMGAEVYAYEVKKQSAWLWYLFHIQFLIKFCRQKRIDIIHSHLQQANLIAIFAQYFIKAKVVVFRHHGKFDHLVQDPQLKPHPNEVRADKLINCLADKIVVPGQAIKDLMMQKEKARADKIEIIPYIYDFDQMASLDEKRVAAIREQYQCRLLLIMVSRMTPYKRHMLILPVVEKLIREGLDIKLLIMDEGPEQIFIEKHIEYKQLSTRIFLPGFKTDILHYIAAADVLLHPSLTEASNSAVKEAGLLKKAVMVCKGVGDFDDYIDHGNNGFLVNPNTFAEETAPLIRQLYYHPDEVYNLGTHLSQTVRERFNLNDKIVDLYENL